MNDLSLHAKGGNIVTLGDLKNPNRMPFGGVLTYLGVPSDQPPGGSNGLKVLIPVEVGRAAIDSLIGMPVNLSASLDDHDTDRVVGVIEEAWIGEETNQGTPVHVSGHIFAKSFPAEADTVKRKQSMLGFSYETSKTSLQAAEHNGEMVAMASSLVFTGCAILYKLSAAYKSTSLAAKAALAQEVNELKNEQNQDQEVIEVVEEAKVDAEVTASEEEVNAAEKAAAKNPKKKPAEGSDEEEAEETPEEEAKEEEEEEKGKKPKDKDDLKASIDTLTALVSKLAGDVADLKAAKEAPAAEVVDEQAPEEIEVEAAADKEPQRRSSETLVSKFNAGEEGQGDVFASIDKQNLSPVDSMAKKLAALFN